MFDCSAYIDTRLVNAHKIDSSHAIVLMLHLNRVNTEAVSTLSLDRSWFTSRFCRKQHQLTMNSGEYTSAFTPVGNLFFPNGTIKEQESYKWASFSPPALWHIWNNCPSNFSANGQFVAERAPKNISFSWPWSLYPSYTSQDYSSALLHHAGYSHLLGLAPCPEDEKPSQSYIGLIGQAILNSPEKKLILSEIYNYIQTQYPYFRKRGTGWRNSIRHNLSLNDCFIKTGRSPNGKGHFWAISPLYYDDFARGVIRRRTSRRAAKSSRNRVSEEIKEIIPVPNIRNKPTTEKIEDKPTAFLPESSGMVKEKVLGVKVEKPDSESLVQLEKPKAYDVESLLAPEPFVKDSTRNSSLYSTESLDERETTPEQTTELQFSSSRRYPYSTTYNSRFLH